MKRYVPIILILLLIVNLAYRIDSYHTAHELIGELMYFPSGSALRIISIGFYAPLADIIWLRFIQYYGEHRLTDTKYELMYHILDILTSCDPYFIHAYTLGSLMLTHDAQRPDQAKNLLRKAMARNPDDWQYPFFYGFIHYVFLSNFQTAHIFFKIAALKPNAPDMPKRWAAFTAYMKLGDLKTAYIMWYDLFTNTKNDEERSIAEYYLKKIRMKLDLVLLNAALDKFVAKYDYYPKSLSELVSFGFLDSIPSEPYGGKYLFIRDKIISSSEYK